MVTFHRRLPRFDYVRPASMDEALDILAHGGSGACRVYAGGTDLIPRLKGRILNSPETLVDLKGIPDLDYIDYDEQHGLRIGALASIRSVATSGVVKEKYPILSQAAGRIASIQVQNRGTLAGNLCNGLPSADAAPSLLCLGAQLLCVGKKGERRINIEDFHQGPGETALHADELLQEIQVPPMVGNSSGVYIKLSPRSRMDLAVVGVATVIASENGRMSDVRIGLGAVAPRPMRAQGAEALLTGVAVDDDEAITKAARMASKESRPISDHRGSAEYRRMMVEVLVKRGIHLVFSGA
ncbi:MAG: xanthine dehydrogenase family protein subunit M [Deltaproteobacteria bacterium]|jgi:CO/xanthine dehydrogenase FAD-binding subunit